MYTSGELMPLKDGKKKKKRKLKGGALAFANRKKKTVAAMLEVDMEDKKDPLRNKIGKRFRCFSLVL